jgi:hypothetical protein
MHVLYRYVCVQFRSSYIATLTCLGYFLRTIAGIIESRRATNTNKVMQARLKSEILLIRSSYYGIEYITFMHDTFCP